MSEERRAELARTLDRLARLGCRDYDQTEAGKTMRRALSELARLGGSWPKPYKTPRGTITVPLTHITLEDR